MSEKKLHFSTVRDEVTTIFEQEGIRVELDFIKYFLNVLSNLCNYEEEGQKIRPRLLLFRNFTDAIITVSNAYLVKTRIGQVNGADMEKIIKSLVPFCNNGWHVFIDIKETEIQYGVIRSFSGPIGLPISENLFEVEDISDVGYSVIEIKAVNNFELFLCGLRKNCLTIDSRFFDVEEDQRSALFPLMIEDITMGVQEQDHREILKKAFENLFRVIPYKVHGTICVVVDADYVHGDFLEDGIWFDEPIDLGAKVIDSVLNIKDIVSAEAYYGLSGLFLEMLNVDGMTIVDTTARVRGFNVFVRKVPEGVVVPNEGGARKRAANTVALSGETKIRGVFFLSQDGNSFYKRVGE